MCYNLLMTLKEHFNKLPNRLSANFFAMLGFTYFLYALLGLLATIITSLPNLIQELHTLSFDVMFYLFPISCLFAIIPTIILFIFLFTTKFKIKTQILIILLTSLIIYIANPLYKFFECYVLFAFASIACVPLVLLAILIYFILLIIDLNKDDCIKNRELVENKYYKIFVNVFYYYFVITLLIGFFFCLYVFFTI